MHTWKQSLENNLIPKYRESIERSSTFPLAIAFDYQNALVRVIIPNKNPIEESKIRTAVANTNKSLGLNLGCSLDMPPAYPFTMVPFSVLNCIVPPKTDDKVYQIEFNQDELISLKKVYRELYNLSQSADYVVAFARGGLPALQYISQLYLPNNSSTEFNVTLNMCQQKFYLLPGLNWDSKLDTKKIFTDWLSSLPEHNRLLIFDTTRTGSSINQIKNLIEDFTDNSITTPFKKLTIVGIYDQSKGLCPSDHQYSVNNIPIELKYLNVQQLLTEDCSERIGYSSLKKESSLEAQWNPAIVELVDSGGDITSVVGTSNLAYTFSDLLEHPVKTKLDSIEYVYASTYIAICTILDNAKRSEIRELKKAYCVGLLSEPQFDDGMSDVCKRYNVFKEKYKHALQRS